VTPDAAALFGLTPPSDDERRLEKRFAHEMKLVGWMRVIYGTEHGHRCGECGSLVRRGNSGRYFKCRKAKITRGPGTDWRVRWVACGQFTVRVPK
jgi:hypothetical protein